MEWHHAKRESAMALTPRYTKFELTTLRATIFAEEDRHKFTPAKGPEAASGISAPPISSALSITGRSCEQRSCHRRVAKTGDLNPLLIASDV